MLQAINSDPAYRVSWCVLLGIPAMWDHPRPTIPMVQVYAPPQTTEPEVPTVSAELQTAISSAFLGTRSGWVEVLKGHEQMHPDSRGGFGMPHPKILELLAGEMKVKVPAMPVWKTPASASVASQQPTQRSEVAA